MIQGDIMVKRKHKKHNAQAEARKNVVRLDQYRKKVAELKEQGESEYKPKIGRQIHKIEEKIKKIA